jgi:hypothetical protein
MHDLSSDVAINSITLLISLIRLSKSVSDSTLLNSSHRAFRSSIFWAKALCLQNNNWRTFVFHKKGMINYFYSSHYREYSVFNRFLPHRDIYIFINYLSNNLADFFLHKSQDLLFLLQSPGEMLIFNKIFHTPGK